MDYKIINPSANRLKKIHSPATDIEYWRDRLSGTRIVNRREEDVGDGTTFFRGDLPIGTRVIRPGTILTADFVNDRLNVIVDEKNKVKQVVHG